MGQKKLRIAQVAPLWLRIPPATYGGIELVIKLMVDELVERGHEVTLFAVEGSQTRARLRAVCHDPLMDLMAREDAQIYEFYGNACVTDALLAANEFDVVHFHIGTQWIPMGLLTATPNLHTLHTFLTKDDAWLINRYPRVPLAAISRFQVQSAVPARAPHIPVVYNGCDFNAFDPSFAPGKYLAFLGRISNIKNPLDAIRIAQKVGMPIVLAGQPQSKAEEQYYEAKIKPLVDGKEVRYIGPVDHSQKNELLRNAAALLFPVQWSEPFGLVMIEAMACGTPVVGHNLGSVGEVVENGVTGFYAQSIDEMSALVPLAMGLDRKNVRRRAMERFSYQAMTDAYLKIYERLIGGI